MLRSLAQAWAERRGDVEQDAASLARAVAEHAAGEGESRGRPEASAVVAAEASLRASFDADNAGFGEAPKFPMPANLRFLLRRHARTGGQDAKTMAVETLRAMTRGGIFDQLGGGYARYSTDHAWRVPHFEKMLYDNAQLLENLADAWAVSRDEEILQALERTVAYLERDLRSPQGGFYSAEDADSLPPGEPEAHKEEGAFYLWKKAEIDALLGKDAEAFCRRYGIVEGSNALSDPHGEFSGKCVLYDNDQTAMEETAAGGARAKLFLERAKRPRPMLDDKILTSWNGLAIAGLARAFGATGNEAYLTLAEGAADFLRRHLSENEGKIMSRRWRDGSRAVAGMADDYAGLAYGLLELHEAGFVAGRLSWAVDLAEEALHRFAAPGGGLYQVAADEAAELFARAIEDHDGVEPSPSSVMVEVCLRLYELTGRDDFRRFVDETLERFGPRLSTRPLSMPFLLTAFERVLGKPRTLLIAGADMPGGAALIAAARAKLRPDLILAGYRGADKDALARVIPIVRDIPDAPRARAYLCVDRACGLPIEDPAELARRLDTR